MNLENLIVSILIFLIPLFIIGLLIFMFISLKKKKNQLNRIKDSLSEGVSKKQIK